MFLDILKTIETYLSTKYYKKYYEKNPKYIFEQDRGVEKIFMHFILNLYPKVRFLEMFRCYDPRIWLGTPHVISTNHVIRKRTNGRSAQRPFYRFPE